MSAYEQKSNGKETIDDNINISNKQSHKQWMGYNNIHAKL